MIFLLEPNEKLLSATKNKTGYIVPFENGEKEFIHAVMELYRHPLLIQEMKRNAYEKSRLYS